MFNLKFLIVGFIVGVGCIAPGLSGGAMAIAFGVYERLIGCIAHWRTRLVKELKFLIPLGIGGVIGVAVCALGLDFLFERFQNYMWIVFIGLMLGTFPSNFKTGCKNGFRPYYILIFLIAMAVTVFGFGAIGGDFPLNPYTALLGGFVFGFGTIIPGVSSSAILKNLGLYEAMLDRCTSLDFTILVPVAIGVIISALILIKPVEILFNKFHGPSSFAFFGMLGGSVIMIIPVIDKFDYKLIISVILAVIGAVGTYFFCKKFDDSSEETIKFSDLKKKETEIK